MEESAELEFLSESLDKTSALVSQMVTMLSSFDDRLRGFETSILPIHKSTQRLNVLYENINKSVVAVDNVLSYFDLASHEEQIILKGPQENNLLPYLTSIGKIVDALKFLTASKFKSGEKALYQLRQLLNTGFLQLVSLFRRWLTQNSVPIDASTLERSNKNDAPKPPLQVLENLAQLATYLSNTSALATTNSSDLADFQKVYVEVRSPYLLKSLSSLASSAGADKDRKRLSVGSGPSTAPTANPAGTLSRDKDGGQIYQKGSAGFIVYTKWVVKFCKAEFEILQHIHTSTAINTMDLTLTALVDSYFETADTLLTKVKRNAGKHDFSEMFLLFDILENLMSVRGEWNDIFGSLRKKSDQMQDMISAFAAVSTKCFPEFLDDVKHSGIKQAAIAVDGTVNEVTSNSLNFLRRLLDYQDTVQIMLQSIGESNWHSSSDGAGLKSSASVATLSRQVSQGIGSNPGIIRKYFLDVLDALNSNLESKSRQYKKSVVASIFLLNNYHYVYKSIRSHPKLLSVVGKEIEVKYEKLYLKSKDSYLDSWKPILERLMSIMVIPKDHLKTSEKNSIKDKLKDFNTDFEDANKLQKNIAIPDSELRATTIKEIRTLLVPLYTRLLEKIQTADFSKNPQKYLKYDAAAIESMLDRFFDASS